LEDKTVQNKQTTNTEPTDEDKQFIREHSKGYEIKPTSPTHEVVYGVIWFVKVAFLLFIIVLTIIMLIVFIPLGLLMLLGTYGIYKILF
jgi:hypothetical protein